MGNGTLTRINGTMGTIALLGGLDFEDMFLINIVDPMKFRATTDPFDAELMGGDANFDTMVWIFGPTSADPLKPWGFLATITTLMSLSPSSPCLSPCPRTALLA